MEQNTSTICADSVNGELAINVTGDKFHVDCLNGISSSGICSNDIAALGGKITIVANISEKTLSYVNTTESQIGNGATQFVLADGLIMEIDENMAKLFTKAFEYM